MGFPPGFYSQRILQTLGLGQPLEMSDEELNEYVRPLEQIVPPPVTQPAVTGGILDAIKEYATPSTALRIGLPIAGGIAGSLLGPAGTVGGIKAGLMAAGGAAIGGALGEAGAEALEGQPLDAGEIALAGGLSALPAGPAARAIKPGMGLAARAGLHALEGAGQGAVDVLGTSLYRTGELPSGEELVAGGAFGGVLGTGLGLGMERAFRPNVGQPRTIEEAIAQQAQAPPSQMAQADELGLPYTRIPQPDPTAVDARFVPEPPMILPPEPVYEHPVVRAKTRVSRQTQQEPLGRARPMDEESPVQPPVRAPEPILERPEPAVEPTFAESSPRYAFRARDVGEQGIPGVGHSQASLSEADVRRIAPSRTEAPQEVVKVDLGKLVEGQDYIIHERPGADPWVQFKRPIPEEMVEKGGEVTALDREAASKAAPPLRQAVAQAPLDVLAQRTGLPAEAVEKGRADVDADGTRELSPEAVAVKRAVLQEGNESLAPEPFIAQSANKDSTVPKLGPIVPKDEAPLTASIGERLSTALVQAETVDEPRRFTLPQIELEMRDVAKALETPITSAERRMQYTSRKPEMGLEGMPQSPKELAKLIRSRKGPVYREALRRYWDFREGHRTAQNGAVEKGGGPSDAIERSAIQEEAGDVSFDPAKYAVRPSPGQRGLEGIAEDRPLAQEKKRAPEQEDLFGAGAMLQPTERLSTEGREAEGSLFTQERDAQIKADKGRQASIPIEPEPTKEVPRGSQISKPITGTTGAQIVGYEWRSVLGERMSNREGGLVSRRVSDWDNSDVSTGTGREIVHVFYVKHPDGTVSPEGVRSAQKLLGMDETRLRTIAKREQRTQAEKRHYDRLFLRDTERYASETPADAARKWRLRNPQASEDSIGGTVLLEKDGRYFRALSEGRSIETLESGGWKRVADPLFTQERDAAVKEDEGRQASFESEAPEPLVTPAATKGSFNPFAEKARRARELSDRLNTPTAREQAYAESFPLGAGFGHGSARQLDKRGNASVDRAVKAVEAAKNARYLEGQAAAFEAGQINAQGRRSASTAADSGKDMAVQRLFLSLKVGDSFNPGGGPLKIIRKNRYSITTEGGTTWGLGEVTGLRTDEARAIVDRLSAKPPTPPAEPRDSGAIAEKAEGVGEGQDTPGVKFGVEGNENFKRWFGNSKVVDENGAPLRVFHGTPRDFTVFNKTRDLGFHFGTKDAAKKALKNKQSAGNAASNSREQVTLAPGKVIEVYLSLQKPARMPDLQNWSVSSLVPQLKRLGLVERDVSLSEFAGRGFERGLPPEKYVIQLLKDAGHDGIQYTNTFEGTPADSWVAFEPTQIKSATGNRGTFDPTNPDIRYATKEGRPSEPEARTFLREVKKNWSQIPGARLQGDALVFTSPTGKPIHVRPSGEIRFTKSELRQGHGEKTARAVEAGESVVVGRTYETNQRIVAEALDTGTIDHEIGHVLKDHFASPKERHAIDTDAELRALAAKSGRKVDEEWADWLGEYVKARRAGQNIPAKSVLHRVAARIYDFLVRIYDTFNPSKESVARGAVSGRIFERKAQSVGETKAKYATAPAATGATQQGPRFSIPEETALQKFQRGIQDKFNRVSTVQTAIREQGGRVTERTDVAAAIDAFGPKVAEKLADVDKSYVAPLVKGLAKDKADLSDLGDYMSLLHAPDRDAVISRRTNGQTQHGSGWTPQEVQARWAELERKYGPRQNGRIARLEPHAGVVRRMRDDQLRILEDGGLISPQQAQSWKAEFGDHYVPMRTAEALEGPGTGMGFNIQGREAKQATGRSTKADNPVTFMLQQLERAIVRAEKNKADIRLAELIRDNPDSALWQIDRKHTRKELDAQGKVTEVRDLAAEQEDLHYKEGGVAHRISVSDPLTMRALKNMSAQETGKFLQTVGKATRLYSTLVTTYSPEFLFTNFARDIQTALTNVSVDQGAKVTAATAKNVFPSMKAMYRVLTNPNARGRMETFAREFREDGGTIGFYNLKDVPALQKTLESKVKTAGPGAIQAAKRVAHGITGWIEQANKSVENGSRLSAYIALREAGASRQKAAQVARNLTVNFTKKGEAGTAVNALYAFFNANVQGTKRLLEAVGSKRGAAMAASITGLGAVMDHYNRAASGDKNDDGTNDYDEIPEYVKERNLVFVRGNGKSPFLFPMPYGYNVLHNLGRLASAASSEAITPQKAAVSFGSAAINAFNPLGSEADIVQVLSPTMVDPFVQSATNKDFAGRPIMPDKFPGQAKPDSERYFKNVPTLAKQVAQALNKATGGDEVSEGYISVSPETIDHYWKFASGGLGRFASNATSTVAALAEGEAPSVRETPLARRFVYEPTPGLEGQKYRENQNALDEEYQRYKHYIKSGERDKARAVAQKIRVLKPKLDAIERRINALKRRPDSQDERVSNEIARLMRLANKTYSQAPL